MHLHFMTNLARKLITGEEFECLIITYQQYIHHCVVTVAIAFDDKKVTHDSYWTLATTLKFLSQLPKYRTVNVFKECFHIFIFMNPSLQRMIGRQCFTRHWMSKSKRLIKIQCMSPWIPRYMSLETHGWIRYLVTWWTRCQVVSSVTLWVLNTIL